MPHLGRNGSRSRIDARRLRRPSDNSVRVGRGDDGRILDHCAVGVFTPDPDPKYAAALTAVSPLSAGRRVSCEGAVEPAAILAMTGDASKIECVTVDRLLARRHAPELSTNLFPGFANVDKLIGCQWSLVQLFL